LVAYTGFTASSTNVTAGQSITLDIKTTTAVNHVYVDCDGQRLAATFQSADSAGIKSWRILCSPASSQTINVYASASTSVSGAAVISIPVTVSTTGGGNNTTPGTTVANNGTVSINSVTVSSDVFYIGDLITFTLTTNNRVAHVWTQCDGAYFKAALQSTDAAGNKTWLLSLRPSQAQTLKIEASERYQINSGVSVQQPVNPRPASERPATALINSVTANETDILLGRNITITIRTNAAANFVWVNCDGRDVQAVLSAGATSTTKTWTVTVRPDKTQSILVYANSVNAAANAATNNIRVTVRDYDDVKIHDVFAEWSTTRDDEVIVEVVTNDAASHVRVEGTTTANLRGSTPDRHGNVTWTGTVRLTQGRTITVFASYDRNSPEEKKEVDVTGGGSGTVGITKVLCTSLNEREYTDTTPFTRGSNMRFAIETDFSVHSVWVEDNYGNEYEITTPSRVGNRYVWTRTFSPGYPASLADGNVEFFITAVDSRDRTLDTTSILVPYRR
jgi:hypothetical protein